ncbi:YciI family protein [Govanella unica]|uniref:YciI family protein n=1 Tax=Govanella unica TaxID=2975056 RepID=A0A9X3TYV9_9PROT|nr:YciI family protein [Govania unica]MDA5194480.1 YciI family protein [Govania unica]
MSKLFVIIAIDNPDSLALRQATRAAHLDHARSIGDRMKYGGPFLTDSDTPEPRGSLLILEADDLAAAKAFAAADPYAEAGLFASVRVEPVGAVLGSWLGAA